MRYVPVAMIRIVHPTNPAQSGGEHAHSGANPYLFIVGCPRSGTTLLQRIVNAHPEVAVVNETQLIPRWFERRKGLTSDGLVTPALIPSLLEYPRLKRLKVGREELERLIGSGEPLSFADFMSAVFDHVGRCKGKRLVGDKTPTYVRSIPTLHGLWPRARFVHLLRDGRDVHLSLASFTKADGSRAADRIAERFSTWAEDPVSTGALHWERLVRLGQEDGRALGPDLYYELRYEALVADPEAETVALCAFLGLPYHDRMLRFHEGRTKAKAGLDAKKAWLPITAGLRDWRSQMPADDVERFEAAAGGLLGELGYPRAVPHPSAARLEHAARIRVRFNQDLRAQGERLPAS